MFDPAKNCRHPDYLMQGGSGYGWCSFCGAIRRKGSWQRPTVHTFPKIKDKDELNPGH